MAVSVVVVTHDSEPWIRPCLDALADQDYEGTWEVVLVDNGSTDGTREIVAHEYPHVRLIESENRGYGAGCNLGARHARGRLLAFLNPDTEAEAGWLRHLVAPLEENHVLTTSKILLGDEPGRINTFGNRIHFTGLGFTRGHLRPADTVQGDETVPAISGAAFAIRRDDFDQLGCFDEAFFLYLDDTDLSIRAHRHGIPIRGVAQSRIRHHYRVRTEPAKLRNLQRGHVLLIRKHLRWRDRILYLPSLIVSYVLLWTLAVRHGPKGVAAKLHGTWQGWTARPARDATRRIAPWTYAERTLPWPELTPSRPLRFLGRIVNALYRLNTLTWNLRKPKSAGRGSGRAGEAR